MPSKLTCILYLEPTHSSQFYQSILKFYDQSLKLFGPNNAHQYDPHISMTGFFTLYDNQRIINGNIDADYENSKEYISAYKKLDQIIQFINNFLNNNHNITYPLVKDIIISMSNSLLISVQVCQEMLDLVNQLSQLSFDESNSNVLLDNSTKTIIRPKQINHFSLAYSDGLLSKNTMKNLESMANKIIVFDEVKQQECGWDIVLYEKIHHSTKLEEKHVLKEIKR
ncbi:25697_t:CDS:2 [Dentiscutata erythropus]|uniref:25697_t:CDS:1 n=1 Tax=Dentiscutata erythropus TaxID=1348616 RepID=A0A9N8VT85_9GLOM|nr:25697_t:CDS:2 [Dentiscutata erythropus]